MKKTYLLPVLTGTIFLLTLFLFVSRAESVAAERRRRPR